MEAVSRLQRVKPLQPLSDSDPWFASDARLDPVQAYSLAFALRLWLQSSEVREYQSDRTFLGALWQLLRPLMSEARQIEILRLQRRADDDNNPDDEEDDFVASVMAGEQRNSLRGMAGSRLRRWLPTLAGEALAELRRRHPEVDQATPCTPTLKVLAEALDLSSIERDILNLVYLREEHEPLRMLLRECQAANPVRNVQRVAWILNRSPAEVNEALMGPGVLRQLELLMVCLRVGDLEDFMMPSEFFSRLIQRAPLTQAELLDILVEPLPASRWTLADFPHLQDDLQFVAQALAEAGQTRQAGVNALFYGVPGSGKTEAAAALAAHANLFAVRVKSAGDQGNGLNREERLSAYGLVQRLLAARRDCVVVFDEVEDVFGAAGLHFLRALLDDRSGPNKGYLNRLLEENAVPAIWITNDGEGMDVAYQRRFLFPLAFRTPPRRVRQRIVDAQLGDVLADPGLREALAADPALLPAQFAAARRAVALSPNEPPERVVARAVSAQRRLLQGSALPSQRQRPMVVDLEFLNLAGDLDPARIIAAMERRGRGSLCLYGPPGTGKTEFAHVLADALDRELVVRRASELKSKYVGETEQQIAALFNETDPARSVLFLDEVDSFLRDRTRAERSWEVSEVNELLQHMEAFPGIFVAATNLMSLIDPAALRRFDFKLAFQPLAEAQRCRLFAREVYGDPDTEVSEAFAQALSRLQGLTAGDFANVVRQHHLLDEPLEPVRVLQRLRAELVARTRER